MLLPKKKTPSKNTHSTNYDRVDFTNMVVNRCMNLGIEFRY